MPTYEYRCKECGEDLEVVQSFQDDALTECPSCGGPLRKVFGNVGISFKGSGFYKTDSRSGAKSSTSTTPAAGEGGSSSSEGSSSEGSSSAGGTSDGGSSGSDSTPAKRQPAATSSAGSSSGSSD